MTVVHTYFYIVKWICLREGHLYQFLVFDPVNLHYDSLRFTQSASLSQCKRETSSSQVPYSQPLFYPVTLCIMIRRFVHRLQHYVNATNITPLISRSVNLV